MLIVRVPLGFQGSPKGASKCFAEASPFCGFGADLGLILEEDPI